MKAVMFDAKNPDNSDYSVYHLYIITSSGHPQIPDKDFETVREYRQEWDEVHTWKRVAHFELPNPRGYQSIADLVFEHHPDKRNTRAMDEVSGHIYGIDSSYTVWYVSFKAGERQTAEQIMRERNATME